MLTYLSSNWLMFLIFAAASYILGVMIQLFNMKRMSDSLVSFNDKNPFFLFFIAAIFFVSGTINGILFLIGVVMAIIQTAKA